MIPITRDARSSPISGLARIGTQPIAVTAAALVLILAGVAGIALSRAYTGQSPETDRAAVARALQARAAQASQQLAEKTKGLEETQQDSIDQLQVMQDQLQTVRRQLAAQQADSKRLADQVSSLTEAVDGLRQSFASAQSSDPSPAPAAHNRSVRTRAHAVRGAQRRVKSHS
jgi:flagellar motility protein MotE (MotC chaperone)